MGPCCWPTSLRTREADTRGALLYFSLGPKLGWPWQRAGAAWPWTRLPFSRPSGMRSSPPPPALSFPPQLPAVRRLLVLGAALRAVGQQGGRGRGRGRGPGHPPAEPPPPGHPSLLAELPLEGEKPTVSGSGQGALCPETSLNQRPGCRRLGTGLALLRGRGVGRERQPLAPADPACLLPGSLSLCGPAAPHGQGAALPAVLTSVLPTQ